MWAAAAVLADRVPSPDGELRRYFRATEAERAAIALPDAAYAKLKPADQEAMRNAALAEYRVGAEQKRLAADYGKRIVNVGGKTMPFTLEKRGNKPEGGWPVLMALHGGGNAPKALNDQQWEHMQKRYPISNCIYIAPRAPTDEWNGFYTDYVYPLFIELSRMLVIFEEINPDRVYLIGYSHGGYGAYAMGPKMPHRFGAVHSSAAAATDGQCAAENLRDLRFTFMIGERDTMYGRLDRCKAFATRLTELKKDAPKEAFPVAFYLAPGRGHSDLPDFRVPEEMFKHTRNPVPRRLTWKLTDPVIRDFYWLSVDEPAAGMSIEATCEENRVTLSTQKAPKAKDEAKVRILLDGRLIDPAKPVTLTVNGKERFSGKAQPKLSTWCRTLLERGDPKLAFDVEFEVAP